MVYREESAVNHPDVRTKEERQKGSMWREEGKVGTGEDAAGGQSISQSVSQSSVLSIKWGAVRVRSRLIQRGVVSASIRYLVLFVEVGR